MASIEYLAEKHKCPKCGSESNRECYEDLGKLGWAPMFYPHKERLALVDKNIS